MTTPFPIPSAAGVQAATPGTVATRAKINRLVALLTDGARGFAEAAKKTEGLDSGTLETMGAERSERLATLKTLAGDEGIDVDQLDDDGSATAAIHRTWLELRNLVQGDEGVIAAALGGERHAKDELTDIVGQGIPAPFIDLASNVLGDIEGNLSTLEQLKTS